MENYPPIPEHSPGLLPQNRPSVNFGTILPNISPKNLPHQPYRLTVEENGRKREFEYLPQRDTIHILLFDQKRNEFLMTRYFRPEVFASRLMQLPKNKKESHFGHWGWHKYDRKHGCTLELSCRVVEKGSRNLRKKALQRNALAIIEDDFGIKVDKKNLHFIDSFLTGVTDSGAYCHLYYAEVDYENAMSDGKKIKVWLKKKWAEYIVDNEGGNLEYEIVKKEDNIHSTLYYALSWWFFTHDSKYTEASTRMLRFSPTYTNFGLQCSKRESKEGSLPGKWRCKKSEQRGRHTIWSMKVEMVASTDWELHSNQLGRSAGREMEVDIYVMMARPDTVSILVKDVDSMEVVMTKRFRPARIGPLFMKNNNEDELLEDINVTKTVKTSAYAYELASGKMGNDETEKQAVKRIAALRLGYEIPEENIKRITRLLVGSSIGGESKSLYYAECKKEHRMETWKGDDNTDIERVKLHRWSYSKYVRPHNSPPSVYIALNWMALKEPRMTEEDVKKKEEEEKKEEEDEEMKHNEVVLMKKKKMKKGNKKKGVLKMEEDTSILSPLNIPPTTERREEGERLKEESEKKKRRKRMSDVEALWGDDMKELRTKGLVDGTAGRGGPRMCKTGSEREMRNGEDDEDEEPAPKQKNRSK